jgi:hypothetical protein
VILNVNFMWSMLNKKENFKFVNTPVILKQSLTLPCCFQRPWGNMILYLKFLNKHPKENYATKSLKVHLGKKLINDLHNKQVRLSQTGLQSIFFPFLILCHFFSSTDTYVPWKLGFLIVKLLSRTCNSNRSDMEEGFDATW